MNRGDAAAATWIVRGDETLPQLVHSIETGPRLRYKYAPPTFADEVGLTSDKYIVLNNTVSHLPLALSFQPLSFARWQLMSQMERGIKSQQEDLGFSDNDVDEVRRLIADTKTSLLAVTMLASVLHLLFEFLAFKSDVEFWKKNTSLRGLSTRSIVVDLISQIVVLARGGRAERPVVLVVEEDRVPTLQK